MSVVYQAENLRLSSVIALKVLAAELAADDVFRVRFLEESPFALPASLSANRRPAVRRSVCAAGQPACTQVSRCIGLSGSDRKFPALTDQSGTQRARRPLRPELAALLGVWPSSCMIRPVAQTGHG